MEIIPSTKVNPTDLIGAMSTIVGAINTENPITVVTADSRTATPVDCVISRTACLNKGKSHKSGTTSNGSPLRFLFSFSVIIESISFRLASSILLTMCRA